MAKMVIEGTDVTASQLAELNRQIANGALRREHVQAFLEHKNPFPKLPAIEYVAEVLDFFSTGGGMNIWMDRRFAPRIQKYLPQSVVAVKPAAVYFEDLQPYSEGCDFLVGHFALNQVMDLMKAQKDGEPGILLVDGRPNLFFLNEFTDRHDCNPDGAMMLHVFWHQEKACWGIDLHTDEADDPSEHCDAGGWDVAVRVFKLS